MPQHKHLDLLSILLTLFEATATMTQFKGFERSSNSLEAFWKSPYFPVHHFQLSIQCKYICNKDYHYDNEVILLGNITSFLFSGLAHGVQCDVTLKAVYNPASIDGGIHVSYVTLPASEKRLTTKCSCIC